MGFNGTCTDDFYPCETCDYMKYNTDQDIGLHCYMFMEKPVPVCMKHSSRPRSTAEEAMKITLEVARALRST